MEQDTGGGHTTSREAGASSQSQHSRHDMCFTGEREVVAGLASDCSVLVPIRRLSVGVG